MCPAAGDLQRPLKGVQSGEQKCSLLFRVGVGVGVDSLVAQTVKNLPAVQKTQETQVQSLGLGRSPGEGHSNPLHYSCLGNPTDRGACQATVQRVAVMELTHQ